jgi:hypothetical protein
MSPFDTLEELRTWLNRVVHPAHFPHPDVRHNGDGTITFPAAVLKDRLDSMCHVAATSARLAEEHEGEVQRLRTDVALHSQRAEGAEADRAHWHREHGLALAKALQFRSWAEQLEREVIGRNEFINNLRREHANWRNGVAGEAGTFIDQVPGPFRPGWVHPGLRDLRAREPGGEAPGGAGEVPGDADA